MPFRPDPKPPARKRARPSSRPKTEAYRKPEPCRCGCGARATDEHHLVLRSGGGARGPKVMLAHECHMRFHSAPDGRAVIGARIRRHLTTTEREQVVALKSERYLDRYYPEAS